MEISVLRLKNPFCRWLFLSHMKFHLIFLIIFFPCWASQCVPRCVCLSVGGCVSLQLSPFILIYVSQVCPYIFGLALLVFQCIFFVFFGRDLARVRVASRCSYLDICLLSVGSEDFDSHPVVFLILSTSLPVVAWLWLVWDGGFWILCFYLPQLLVSLLSLIYLFLLVTQKVSCGYARYTGTLLSMFLWGIFFGVTTFLVSLAFPWNVGFWRSPQKLQGDRL